MAAEKSVKQPNSTFEVDYVIQYKFAGADVTEAEETFASLIQALTDVGLSTEVRTGDRNTVLIFVRSVSTARLSSEVYQARVLDWLHGVRTTAPGKDMQLHLDREPVTDAERLRLVYLLITKPKSEGGAGITPQTGSWQSILAIFPVHNQKFNQQWLKHWSTKTFLNHDDLTRIRDQFGEQVAYYFAFLQSYLMFLIFPASFGFASWFLLGQYSIAYALVNCLWCVVFVEYWKKQEVDLAVQWGVRGVSKIQRKRATFQYETIAKDPITGEEIKVFSPVKRLSRQLLQIPFALLAVLGLGSLIAFCFAIEIFISEVYGGPFKQYLTFLPTIILTVMTPTLSTILTGFAERLTSFENYETIDEHDASMVQKIFVLNFITSYLPVFLTAFVYVPFATVLVPYLDFLKLTVRPFAADEKEFEIPPAFHINPNRLKHQVIYFTVTAQVVNLLMEVVVPYITRKATKGVQRVQSRRTGAANLSENDAAAEAPFLEQVRNEAELPPYDVTVDLREMVVQFGYLSLFSVVWPATAVSFIVNNWIELRSDAFKITQETQRPIPWRADSIGPWLDALGMLTWLGTISTAALVYLFRGIEANLDGDPSMIQPVYLLLTLTLSEHIYLVVQYLVRLAISKIDSPGLQKERKERFVMRKEYLDTNGFHAAATTNVTAAEHAQFAELPVNAPPEQRFWAAQRGPRETVIAGHELMRIARACDAAAEGKKTQ